MSKRRPSLSGSQFDPVDHDHTSQGLLARIINKLLFRNGSSSVLRRMIRGGHGVVGRDTANLLLEGRAKGRKGTAGERGRRQSAGQAVGGQAADAAPSLFSGYSAFMAGEMGHGDGADKSSEKSRSESCRKGESSSPSSSKKQQPDDRRLSLVSLVDDAIVPLELTAEEFELLLEDTPEDRLLEVLAERRSEYTMHLRRLENARKQLVLKMREVDEQIMSSSSCRKDIDTRIAVIKEEMACHEPQTKADDTVLNASSKGSLHNAKVTTVEDVSDDEDISGGDSGNDAMTYEQDDVPRLRELRQMFTGHYGGITAIDYDDNQGLVASGSLDTQVRVWDSDSGECKYTISGHSDIIRDVQFYDRFLITGANDGRMRMWDLSLFDSVQPRPSTKIMREEYVAPSRDGSGAVHSEGDNEEDDSGDEYDNMMFPRRPAAETAYDNESDGDDVDKDGHGHRKGRRSRKPKTIMTLQSTTPPVSPTICHHVPPLELCCENTFVGHKDAVTCFQASYGKLISGGADKTIREWDLSTGQLRQTIDVNWATKDSHSTRVVGRNLASSSPSPWSSPRIGDRRSAARAMTPLTDFSAPVAKRGTDEGDGGFVGALQFYDFALATGTADGVLRLWDLRTAQAHRQMFGHSQPITSLQFDEQTILTGSLDGTAQLWDLRSGRVLQTLTYGRPVTKVQVSEGRASYATQCWLAAGDSSLHHYSGNSMQRVSYASDFGARNNSQRKWQLINSDSGSATVTRVRALGSDTLLSGDANGVVKLWRV